MYPNSQFKVSDPQKPIDFMRNHAFPMIIGVDAAQRPVATQVPVLIEEREGQLFIHGHIMRKTDHHLAWAANPNLLAIFTGAHAYISASWYKDPHMASTWNYMSVHARGLLRWMNDKELQELLHALTNQYETDPGSAARFEKMPEGYVQKLIPAIIGFSIEVTALDHVFKLSQNRDSESYDSIIDHLSKGNPLEQEIALQMQKNRADLFEKTSNAQ